MLIHQTSSATMITPVSYVSSEFPQVAYFQAKKGCSLTKFLSSSRVFSPKTFKDILSSVMRIKANWAVVRKEAKELSVDNILQNWEGCRISYVALVGRRWCNVGHSQHFEY